MRITLISGVAIAVAFLTVTPAADAGSPGVGRGTTSPVSPSNGHAPAPGKGPQPTSKPTSPHVGKPSSTPTSPSTTTPGTTPPTSPIAQKIESHPQLATRLQALLPPGSTLNQAALGFKNQGQFIAALHVSHNLGIPFTDLKTQMVDRHLSLGQSIHTLKPTANSSSATREAEAETDRDLRTSGAAAPSKTGTPAKTTKPSTDRRDDK